MTHYFSASEVGAIFNDRGIDPDKDFLAAAGEYTGYVLAWKLPEGEYLIEIGNENNGDRYYTVTDDIDDLARFLIAEDACGINYILEIANVRGPEYIEAASEDAEGPFYIVKTRYWIDRQISDVVEDDDRMPRRFPTYAKAQAWIDAEKAKPYTKVPDEIDVPSYVIVAVP